ncbi:unnamed protein product [Symbiodinium sp. CCMP2592]|nr:unnamed protein product [Symbiodinium sp. CCMP2592]
MTELSPGVPQLGSDGWCAIVKNDMTFLKYLVRDWGANPSPKDAALAAKAHQAKASLSGRFASLVKSTPAGKKHLGTLKAAADKAVSQDGMIKMISTVAGKLRTAAEAMSPLLKKTDDVQSVVDVVTQHGELVQKALDLLQTADALPGVMGDSASDDLSSLNDTRAAVKVLLQAQGTTYLKKMEADVTDMFSRDLDADIRLKRVAMFLDIAKVVDSWSQALVPEAEQTALQTMLLDMLEAHKLVRAADLKLDQPSFEGAVKGVHKIFFGVTVEAFAGFLKAAVAAAKSTGDFLERWLKELVKNASDSGTLILSASVKSMLPKSAQTLWSTVEVYQKVMADDSVYRNKVSGVVRQNQFCAASVLASWDAESASFIATGCSDTVQALSVATSSVRGLGLDADKFNERTREMMTSLQGTVNAICAAVNEGVDLIQHYEALCPAAFQIPEKDFDPEGLKEFIQGPGAQDQIAKFHKGLPSASIAVATARLAYVAQLFSAKSMVVLGLDALLLFRAGDIPPARQLLWQILRQWTGCPDTPCARLVPLDAPHDCPRLSQVDLSTSKATRLLNAAVVRRLSREGYEALGCLRDWSPAIVRPLLLAAAARGPVLSDDHHIAVVHQERCLAQRRDWHALGSLIDRVVLGPVSRLWEARAHLLTLAMQPAWRPFLEAVESLQGFGPFWTGILAWDCRALGVATQLPSDRLQYCPWGLTGARAGLNLLRGSPRRAPLEAAACRAWGQALLRFLRRASPASILGEPVPPYELFSVQWWCCELSKTPSRVWSGLLALAITEKKCRSLWNARAMLEGLKLEDLVTTITASKTRLTQPPAKAKGGVAMFTLCASEFCLSFLEKNPTPPQIQRGLNDIYKLVLDDFQLKKEDLPNSVKEKLDSLAKTTKEDARTKDKLRMPPPPAPPSAAAKR